MKVRVQNFQSLKDTEVEVEGLTVLVGPSHRGKSAFIRAVEGALFNRPGDQFVREGASKAVVTIEGLPTLSSETISVTWTKGKSVNDYLVNGVAFSRVGTGAPTPIDEAGYRDVWIGDKDRKKGSYIRPQVATQFEPLFLLTQTGSFISDVLSVISRHTVLLTAQGRCGSDLKGTKQLLGVRRSDRDEEDIKLTVLTEVPALGHRVAALVEADKALYQLHLRVTRGRDLLLRRRETLAVIRDLPAATDIQPALVQVRRWATGTQAAIRRTLLGRVPQPLPAPTEVASDTVTRYQRAATLYTAYLRLLRVTRWLLPPPSIEVQAPLLVKLQEDCRQARGLLGTRRRLQDTAVRQMPGAWSEKVPKITPWQTKANTLAGLVGRRTLVLVQVQRAGAAFAAAKVEEEQAEATLAKTMTDLDVCPLCQQEMPHVHA